MTFRIVLKRTHYDEEVDHRNPLHVTGWAIKFHFPLYEKVVWNSCLVKLAASLINDLKKLTRCKGN